jgi:hypothetical protein
LIDEVTDETVKAGIAAAHERLRKKGVSAYDQMHAIVYAHGDDDLSAELVTVIAEMEIDKKQEGAVNLIYEAQKRFPRAVAEGILRRLREGRTLPYHAPNLMAGSGFAFEDDALRDIALEGSRSDDRASAAVSVLGPRAVGQMIEKMFEAQKLVRDVDGKYDKAAGDRYHAIQDRIGQAQIASLLVAIAARSAQADNQEMADLADLISRHPNGENDRGQPFNAAALTTIAEFVEDWANRLLGSDEATRAQLASIATLASHAQYATLLPLLKRLLDNDLRRWRAFKDQARVDHYRGGTSTDEARMSWTLQYQRAFHAIGGPETAALMREYLSDEEFGHPAALVLAEQWRAVNEPSDGERWRSGVDFSRVEEKRAARAADPAATSGEAEAIFSAIEPLIANEATEEAKKHAVALGIVAARLPHGERDAVIQKLLSLAPRRPRAALLQNLILSGVIIDIEMVKQGLAEMFEAAKKQSWILSEGYEIKEWLRLLPYTNRPGEAFDVVRTLPDDQRSRERLEEMITAIAAAPGVDAENVLFQLADADARLYVSHVWREAAMRRGTLSAARRFVDLAAKGVFYDKMGTDLWHMSRQLGGLMGEHPELRAHVYSLLKDRPISPGLALLAQSVAEEPDAEGLLLLVRIEIEEKRTFLSWRSIQSVLTKQVPSEDWKGAYDVVPVPAAELRRMLLSMTTDGGPTDAAARCLNQIDRTRDDYGTPEFEPRHPDLASGKAWPIMTHDPDASETE